MKSKVMKPRCQFLRYELCSTLKINNAFGVVLQIPSC